MTILDPQLRIDRPLSVVLGAGGIRGMAHIGVLEALVKKGFTLREVVGTSVGAVVLAFHASVGMEIEELRRIGLGISSRHLLAWAGLRRFREPIPTRMRWLAGEIPECMDRLAEASWDRLHHGVDRIGVVAYDLLGKRQIVGHSAQNAISVSDVVRGAAALPHVFPPRACEIDGRPVRLTDGGVVNFLPVDVLFSPPFAPEQILAVDIAKTPRCREVSLRRIEKLRRAHPGIPIVVVSPDTYGIGTILFRSRVLDHLIDSGRRAAETVLADVDYTHAATPSHSNAISSSLLK